MSDAASPHGPLAAQFLRDLARASAAAVATDLAGAPVELETAFGRALEIERAACADGGKLMFIGNGGSAAIASHQSVDYMKNGGMTSITFNDSSLLTCMGNDYGYEHVFSEPIKRVARRADALVAISSSGKSPNILRAVSAAREVGCHVITFSGFKPDNPLRATGDLNFYVASESYGIVEIAHLSLIHAMLEARMLAPRDERDA